MITIEELVNKNYDNLNNTDLFILKYVIKHKEECCHCTIYELADACNVSRTTILRFAKKLSLSGYSELKAVLNLENKSKLNNTVYKMDSSFEYYYRIIDDMKKKDFHPINELIYSARHIYAYATGVMQNNIMNEFRRMFNNSGDYVINIGNSGETTHFLKKINKNDLVFFISLSGENKDTIDFARKLKLRGIKTISITELSDNTLATICNENIYIHSLKLQVGPNKEEDFISSVGFFIAIEVLYLNYQIYKEQRIK